MHETWKVIPPFPRYEASSIGRVRSTVNNHGNYRIHVLKLHENKFGYLSASVYKSGKVRHILAQRLIAMAFIENPKNLPQVNHKNEIKTDNRPENLEWCSVSYNINYGTRNERVSKSTGKTRRERYCKKIEQVNPETKEVVRVWDAARQIEKETGFAHSNILACCNGLRHTRGGFEWRYAA